MDGNATVGQSSPANPALHIAEPLSMTIVAASSSLVFAKGKMCADTASIDDCDQAKALVKLARGVMYYITDTVISS